MADLTDLIDFLSGTMPLNRINLEELDWIMFEFETDDGEGVCKANVCVAQNTGCPRCTVDKFVIKLQIYSLVQISMKCQPPWPGQEPVQGSCVGMNITETAQKDICCEI